MILNQRFDEDFKAACEYAKLVKPSLMLFPVTATDLEQWLKASPTCCGLLELTSNFLPNSWVLEGLPTPQPDLVDLQRYCIAWVIGTYREQSRGEAWYDDGDEEGGGGPGLITFTYPVDDIDGDYTHFADILTSWGFTKLVSFANPGHEGHEVVMLACHTPVASQMFKDGRIQWADLSSMRDAPSVVRVTT